MPIYENPHTGRMQQFRASPSQRCLILIRYGVKYFQERTGATDAEVIHTLGHSLRKPPEEVDRILCESEWGWERFENALKQYYAHHPQPPDQPVDREVFTERLSRFMVLCEKRKERLASVALLNQQLNQQPR